jgi:DNA polymerase I-like protein with 3'-5' exonuclease and polymerase domains
MKYFIDNNVEIINSTLYRRGDFETFLEWLEDKEELALDTETEGFFDHSNKIVMLQISDGKDCYVIDTRGTNYLKRLRGRLEDKLILGQNLKFDYKFLKAEGIILRKIYDTFLVECILTNGKENRELGLGAISEKYLRKSLDKSVRNQFVGLKGQPFTEKQIVYGAEDVEGLFGIREAQLREVGQLDLNNVVDLENDACLALADIEYNGIKLDIDAWLKLADKVESKIPQYEAELDEMVKTDPRLSKFVQTHVQGNLFADVEEGYEHGRDVTIKWSSPTYIAKVLAVLGIDAPSTSEKEISKFQDSYPIIKRFIDYKKDSKLATTYGKNFVNFINPVTKRIHGNFWQILDTFRVSCGGSKNGGKSSVNLQNLPAKNEYLNCFVAEKGWKIIGIDYAAQEARIAACGSKDELWLKTFKDGKDLHSEVCKMMFKIDDSLVKTKPAFLRGKTYRDAAKTLNFGTLFGMSKFKLSKSLSISVDEAESLIKQYFNATKQLKTYLDSCAFYGIRNGYIRSFKPYSGIRYFPQWRLGMNGREDFKAVGEITRASYNTPIQATGALMTKLALVKIREYILKNNLSDKVRLIHVVHDATYCEVKEEFAEEFSQIQSAMMIEAGKEFNLALPMDTDITIESFWTK